MDEGEKNGDGSDFEPDEQDEGCEEADGSDYEPEKGSKKAKKKTPVKKVLLRINLERS